MLLFSLGFCPLAGSSRGENGPWLFSITNAR
jgi:hypothetical protein